jgi:hypothetical protein
VTITSSSGGVLTDMATLIEDHPALGLWGSDQVFLSQKIFPLIKDHAISHTYLEQDTEFQCREKICKLDYPYGERTERNWVGSNMISFTESLDCDLEKRECSIQTVDVDLLVKELLQERQRELSAIGGNIRL